MVLNVLATFLFFRIDLTEEKKYSLNEASKETLNKIDDIVFIKVYLNGNLPAGFVRLRNSCKETLDEFRFHNSFIEYEFIDLTMQKIMKKEIVFIKNYQKMA